MLFTQYEGEVTIYAHSEVINLLKDLADRLLQKKETRFIDVSDGAGAAFTGATGDCHDNLNKPQSVLPADGGRLHLVSVEDGKTRIPYKEMPFYMVSF